MTDIVINSEVAETMAKYVAAADPVIAKQASFEAAVPSAVDLLVSKGLLLADAREVKIAEFKSAPANLIATMSKLASSNTLGTGSHLPNKPVKGNRSEADLAYESALLES